MNHVSSQSSQPQQATGGGWGPPPGAPPGGGWGPPPGAPPAPPGGGWGPPPGAPPPPPGGGGFGGPPGGYGAPPPPPPGGGWGPPPGAAGTFAAPPIPPQYAMQPGAPYGIDPITGMPFSDKQKSIAAILQIMVPFGAGRFYTGHTGIAVAQLLTAFLCGVGAIWCVIDGVMMLTGKVPDAQGRPLRE